MWWKAHSSSARRSVLQDWAAALPGERLQIYDATVRRWELSYAMMSVALDEAISLRSCGKLVFARQQVSIASTLLRRFTGLLVSSFETLSVCGRHARNFPTVEPLHTEYFRGSTGQWAASWSGFVHYVLLGDRSRFLHKVRSLSNMVERLQSEFELASEDISNGYSATLAHWHILECLHYDFNTCLREAEVVLKSFLRTAPADKIGAFADVLEVEPASPRVEETLLRPRFSRVTDASTP
jgi:hypothetical protein